MTPPGLTAWSKVSLIDAVALRRQHRLRRRQPHPPRRPAAAHLPHPRRRQDLEGDRPRPAGRAPVNAVREDPVRKGLLFAGTERAVYVSFDDGDDWQPLRLNMPATSDPRPGGPRRRPGRRHARPRLLDPRRHHAAAAVDRARLPPRAAYLFAPSRPTASRGTSTPTRRCRPRSRPDRTRRTARSSITT